MHTHFTMTGPRQGKWFSLDTCETCERPIEAPNAVTHHHTKAEMLRKGFRFYDEAEQGPLYETWWNDDIEACDCERPDCHTHLSEKLAATAGDLEAVAADYTAAEEECNRLRRENEELRQRLAKIEGLAAL